MLVVYMYVYVLLLNIKRFAKLSIHFVTNHFGRLLLDAFFSSNLAIVANTGKKHLIVSNPKRTFACRISLWVYRVYLSSQSQSNLLKGRLCQCQTGVCKGHLFFFISRTLGMGQEKPQENETSSLASYMLGHKLPGAKSCTTFTSLGRHVLV